MKIRSRPDSGIAVSTSSASYTSSEPHKDTDDIDEPSLTTSCQEMVEKVKQVRGLRFCTIPVLTLDIRIPSVLTILIQTSGTLTHWGLETPKIE